MIMPRSFVWRDAIRHSRMIAVLASPTLLCMAVSGAMTRAGVPAAEAAPVHDDRSMSVGCWDVVAAEWEGEPVDRELLARLQVVFRVDGSWTVLHTRVPVAEGTSTNHQEQSPKTFEMETLGSEGVEPSRYRGIYRLDGDTRVLCIVPEGEPMPDDFTAPMHSDRMLVTLRRTTKPAVGE